ncbi:MAG: hypothetical protein ICV64_05415 [Thermoleophilia bacterium]|nr:hypothetical protein [Thermoleophilia bacterium]
MATATPSPEPERRADTPPLGLGMVPGNAELVVYVLALFLAMLVTWLSDGLGSGAWLDFFKWATAAYLLSRGIAKASRVFEY